MDTKRIIDLQQDTGMDFKHNGINITELSAQLRELMQMLDEGLISPSEYEMLKQKLLYGKIIVNPSKHTPTKQHADSSTQSLEENKPIDEDFVHSQEAYNKSELLQKSSGANNSRNKGRGVLVCILLLAIIVGIAGYLNSNSDENLVEIAVAPGQEFKKITGYCPYSFTVETEPGNNYYIYMEDQIDDNNLSFFVYGGKTVTKYMPVGIYKLYYCYGETWYGIKNKFGKHTSYFVSDTLFQFPDGEDFSGWTVTLVPSVDGNLPTDAIGKNAFPD